MFIYGLKDPRDGRVRYVGKSNEPWRRLADHLLDSRTGKYALHNWLRILTSEGLKPAVVILEEVTEEKWSEAETRWISHHRNLIGKKELLNMTEGGDCGPRLLGSQHGNAVLSEQIVTAIRCDRAAGMTYKDLTSKYNIQKNMLSRLCLGKGWKHADGPLMKPRKVTRLTKEQVKAIRLLYASEEISQQEIARRYDVEIYVINRICAGKTHKDVGGPIGIKHARYWGRGEENRASKLTAADVVEIRQRYASRQESQMQMAHRFGVSQQVIGSVVRGATWKAVGGPISPPRFHPKFLSEADKQNVRKLHAGGVRWDEMARRFGISKSSVYLIVCNQTKTRKLPNRNQGRG